MPDSFDASGLQVASLTELTTNLQNNLKSIYGSDINVDSNSPDGQLIGIIAQAGIDLRELLLNINSGFDPDQAEGVTLDQRCAFVGIKRGAGTFTTVQITVVITASLSLVGLDSQSGIINPQVANLYTIKDDAGNLWYLLTSQAPPTAGTYVYTFQSATIGAVQVVANTITTPVTIVNGVSTVNNSSGALYQGINEESDSDLRNRFHLSTRITSTGYSDSLEAILKNLPSVVSAFVYENNESFSDSFGTAPNSIWCIIDGGNAPDIAQAIFSKKAPGCGMRGANHYNITRANGQIFTAKWDVPSNISLYIKFSVNLPGGAIDRSALASSIVNNFKWGVGEDAVSDLVGGYVRSINPKYRVTGLLLSVTGTTWFEIIASTSPANRFVNDLSRISISS